MKILKRQLTYSLQTIFKNPVYSLVYISIVGLGIFATLIFYTYIQNQYLQSRIPAPPEATGVYIVPLQDVERSFWMYNASDIKLIEQNLGGQGKIAPIVSKKVAVKAGFSQEIIAGVSFNETLSELFTLPFRYGAMFSEMDFALKKCVISFETNDIFFNGQNSVGETIFINGEEFEIIGVTRKGQTNFLNIYNTNPSILIPERQFARIDNDLGQGMYYSVIFVKPNGDSLMMNQLYQYINDNILTKRGLNKKLRSIMTIHEYVKTEFRDQWTEALLLFFIVSLGFFTSLVHQINLSILFNLNRMKNIAIELMVGGTYGGLFTQTIMINALLSFLGVGFSVVVRCFFNSMLKVLHSNYLVSFEYRYLSIAIVVELCCIVLASLITLRHIKRKQPMQLIQI